MFSLVPLAIYSFFHSTDICGIPTRSRTPFWVGAIETEAKGPEPTPCGEWSSANFVVTGSPLDTNSNPGIQAAELGTLSL